MRQISKPSWLTVVGLITTLLLQPMAASACPVCFSATNPEIRLAYYWTAALMTLLPVAVVGTIGGWLYLRARDTARQSSDVTALGALEEIE